MTPPIDIRAEHLRIVQDVLRQHLPNGVKVWVFGSRASWMTKDSSDLDLALEGETCVLPRTLSMLEAAFEESDLPFGVDIVDISRIGKSFRQIVAKQRIPLPMTGSDGEDSGIDLTAGSHLDMADGWVHCTLADACSNIDYGLTASASKNSSGSRFLRITDIVSGHLDWNNVPYVSVDDATAKKYRLHSGDIVVARTGASTGASMYIKKPPPAVFASYLVRLQAKSGFDSRFLAYYLKSPQFWGFIRGVLGDKSAQPNASASTMSAAPLRAPRDKTEQRAIAHILGTLDDKIELNRRMNETLEAMARALFKSWFVDFEPVRAKMEGRDTGLPQDLADLFPDRMVDSELGEMPEGWEVRALETALVELAVGSRPKGGVSGYAEGVPSIGAESIVGLGFFDYSKTKYVPREFFEAMRKGHVKNRDVLLYKDGGRPGEFEPHMTLVGDGFPFQIFAINEHVYRLRAADALGQNFLFFWLSSDLVMEEMRIKGTGVAIPGLNSTQVKSLTTLYPASEVISAFDAIVGSLVAQVLASCNESRTLSALREAVLPKLISGELRVRDVGQFVSNTPFDATGVQA